MDTKFDLILSRHTMFHLFSSDVIAAIRNFKKSGSRYSGKLLFSTFEILLICRYLLMTTHLNAQNQELPKWPRFRPINFFLAPYQLQAPLCIARDTVVDVKAASDQTMYIMLYNLQSLKL